MQKPLKNAEAIMKAYTKHLLLTAEEGVDTELAAWVNALIIGDAVLPNVSHMPKDLQKTLGCDFMGQFPDAEVFTSCNPIPMDMQSGMMALHAAKLRPVAFERALRFFDPESWADIADEQAAVRDAESASF